MSGEHFCFTSPDDPEPLECEQCAVFAERADYWRDASEKRDAWLDAEMDRRRAAEAEVERLQGALRNVYGHVTNGNLEWPDALQLIEETCCTVMSDAERTLALCEYGEATE